MLNLNAAINWSINCRQESAAGGKSEDIGLGKSSVLFGERRTKSGKLGRWYKMPAE